MSYQGKVELWREQNRLIEERRKKAKARASAAGAKFRNGEGVPVYVPLEDGEKSLMRRAFEAFTAWRSRRSLAAEAAERIKAASTGGGK